jgi:hypothetical protein
MRSAFPLRMPESEGGALTISFPSPVKRPSGVYALRGFCYTQPPGGYVVTRARNVESVELGIGD